MIIQNYGQQRDLVCTEEEHEIFEIIKEISGTNLDLVRRSDNYVTASFGDWDVARIKYTTRAKWIQFPIFDTGSKHRISSVDDTWSFKAIIRDSLDHIRKYS